MGRSVGSGTALAGGSGGWHDDGMGHVLAQVNIGRLRAPLDSPRLADFMAALDPVNALADAAPGFVWRLQTEDGNATAVHAFEWDQAGSAGVIMNMSVWESPEALAAFVSSAGHRRVLRRRREWFEPMTEAYTALWWIPQGTVPTPADAEWRIRRLRAHGPTPDAFTLRVLFPPPGTGGQSRRSSSSWIRSSATATARKNTSSCPGATSTP